MDNPQKTKLHERPVLKQNSNGDWTVFLQDSLNGCGLGSLLDLDGDFGPQTLAEVNRFQQKLGLTVNGIVDESTWTALDNHEKLFGWQAEWPSSLSLTGIGGADTLVNVTSSMIQKAHDFMGTAPRFWGRYFQGNTEDGEYLHEQENKPLHDAGIRVLPISRQTNKVDGTHEDGVELGTSHAKDVLETFGEDYLASQGDGFYIFLDVENNNPSLSVPFYKGWSEAVVAASSKVKLLPSVYLNPSDQTTLRNLSAAMKQGAQCLGLWVAVDTNSTESTISSWSREKVKLEPPVPCKVLLRQYKLEPDPEKIYDFNQINPFLDNTELVLQRLILPPA